ncbi:MAG: hypothetical protein VX278_13490 [Myxococcota bacterium]|nr:hypothetical protein [Myxococcota bacterium]
MIFYLLSCVAAEEQITWSGNVYTLTDGQLETAEDGTVELLDLNDSLLYQSQAPYTDSPHYHEFTIDSEHAKQDAIFRVTATGSNPTLWRSTIPETTSIWLNGSLYSIHSQYAQNLLNSLSLNPQDLTTSEVVHLIGRTDVPEEWMGISLSVLAGDGTEQPVRSYYYDDAGFLLPADSSTAIDLFVAINLEPGPITLRVSPPGEDTIEIMYPTRGGDIISAVYLVP